MRGLPTQKSPAFRREMEKGSELSLALKPLMPLAEVGAKLGLSAAMVSRIERRALVKIEHAVKQHAREIGYRR